MKTYTLDGPDTFEQRLDEQLGHLAHDVSLSIGSNLVALILGGGYGRGEGAIWFDDQEGAKPYNDLDLFLIVNEPSQVEPQALKHISHQYEKELEIDVDFSRPVSLKQLRTMPPTLMWHDLAGGHRVLYGPEDILSANLPTNVLDPPTKTEALRLMLNRGAGLLWTMRVAAGIESAPDPHFVKRNYYKTALAAGDAVLIALGAHQVAYTGRDLNYADLETKRTDIAALGLGQLYAEALQFRFSPHKFIERKIDFGSLTQIARHWERTFLWLERERTDRPFPDVESYSRWRKIREPRNHHGKELLKNFARNLSVNRFSWRHPREWLYRQLPPLVCRAKPEDLDWQAQSDRVLEIWRNYN
jgi:hypothetical protein